MKQRLWAWGPFTGVGIEAGCQSGGVRPHWAPLFWLYLHLSIMLKSGTLAVGSTWLSARVHPSMGRKLTPCFWGGIRIGDLLRTVARTIVGWWTRPKRQRSWSPSSIRLSHCPFRPPIFQSISRGKIHIWVQTIAHHGSSNLWLLLESSSIHSNIFRDAGRLRRIDRGREVGIEVPSRCHTRGRVDTSQALEPLDSGWSRVISNPGWVTGPPGDPCIGVVSRVLGSASPRRYRKTPHPIQAVRCSGRGATPPG